MSKNASKPPRPLTEVNLDRLTRKELRAIFGASMSGFGKTWCIDQIANHYYDSPYRSNRKMYRSRFEEMFERKDTEFMPRWPDYKDRPGTWKGKFRASGVLRFASRPALKKAIKAFDNDSYTEFYSGKDWKIADDAITASVSIDQELPVDCTPREKCFLATVKSAKSGFLDIQMRDPILWKIGEFEGSNVSKFEKAEGDRFESKRGTGTFFLFEEFPDGVPEGENLLALPKDIKATRLDTKRIGPVQRYYAGALLIEHRAQLSSDPWADAGLTN